MGSMNVAGVDALGLEAAHDRAPRTLDDETAAGPRMKVVIADDHWMVRESLKQVMKRLQQTIEIHEAESFDEAARTLADHPDVDLMLIDLVMPGFESFAGLRRLRKEFPTVPVVVVSVHEDSEHVMRSLEQGVIGYIPKSAGAPEVERALERVFAGEVSFPRKLLERSAVEEVEAPAIPQPPREGPELTARELEVLQALGKGQSIKRIAAEHGVSDQTVRVHIRNVMKKRNLGDRSAVIHYALNAFGAAGRG
ncbi:response regulator [Methylopila musalis]|uniref:Response regulator n=1 Tax=Methylopila musalis TaxID=1134781 RepID=A0ABW3Z5K2_9HYPH